MRRTVALLTALASLALPRGAARAQEAPLRLAEYRVGGLRTYLTDSWGAFVVRVTNAGPAGRDARVAILFDGREDVQYARDVHIAAESTVAVWVPVGPPPAPGPANSRDIQALLYDRTGGAERLVLPPTQERVRSRPVTYRRREPSTAILLDEPPVVTDPDARPDLRPHPALVFARTLRLAGGMSENLSQVPSGPLPPVPAAFDGVDHVVLAGRRLGDDPPGARALRHWLQQGGRLWVMLDHVDPTVIAPLLGDDLDLQVVDRTSLTTLRLHRAQDDPARVEPREFERPVEMVRVLTGAADRVLHLANGWPASFVRPVGRGKVVFTTLGPEGWHRPRLREEDRAPFANFRDLPVPLKELQELAAEFRPRTPAPAFAADDLRPLLTEEIGYTVPGRTTAAAILGGFVLALVALGIGLRRSRRPELAGWLAPAAALAATGLFVALGEGSRRAVPPTAAAAAVIDAVPGSGEAAVNGLFALYQPSSGPVPLATTSGATLDLDMAGLEGQIRRRVQTGADAWHWEGLALPAGVRDGPFAATMTTGRMSAVARFGPDGLEGRLAAGPFRGPGDALVTSAAREPIAVRFMGDGSFAAGTGDVLPAGQFLAGTVLTDRQQRRQEVFRRLLTGPLPEHLEGRDLLLAWAELPEVPFTTTEGARSVGTALLVLPLEFERPPAGTRVAVPGAFVPYRRAQAGPLRLDAAQPADMRLRFQLPPSVVPLAVERATLTARVRAPGWRLSVRGERDRRAVPLAEADSPAGPVRVEIADPALLQMDAQGGLYLNVALAGGSADVRWVIESLSLDVVGTTQTVVRGP